MEKHESSEYTDTQGTASHNCNDIILDYNILEDSIYHRTGPVDSLFGLPRMIKHAQDYLIRYSIIQPESAKDFLKLIRGIRNGSAYEECIVRARCTNGDLLWILIMLTSVFDENGTPIRAVGILKDITSMRNDELNWNNDLCHRDIIMREAVVYYEANLTRHKLVFGCDAFLKSMGISTSADYNEIFTLLVDTVVYPEERAAIRATFSADTLLECYHAGKKHVELEYRRLTGEGKIMWMRGTAYLAEDKFTHDILLYFCANDITEHKMHELSLKDRAEKDALTGLYNKISAEFWIRESLEHESSPTTGSALLLIYLNNFHVVNERMGRYFGDALLSKLGHNLLKSCCLGDIAGRSGGVELLLYIQSLTDKEPIQELVEKIYDLLCRDQSDVLSKCSFYIDIGAASSPESGTSFDELYRNASLALQSCKQHQKHICIYEPNMIKPSLDYMHSDFTLQEDTKPFSENVTEHIFHILYDSNNLDVAIQRVLELVRDNFDFHRGYIFDILPNGSVKLAYESLEPGAEKVIDEPVTLNAAQLQLFEDCFAFNHILFLQKDELAEKSWIPESLSQRLIYAFKTDNRLSGFIGFDYYDQTSVVLTKEMRDTIQNVSQIMDVFLANRNTYQELWESTLLLQNIVDGMRSCTYIMDPSTHLLKYVNQNTQNGMPEAQPGKLCYKIFRGRTDPCDDCPIDRMLQDGTTEDRCEMYLDQYGMWALINASLITGPSGQLYGVFNGFDFSEHKHQNMQSMDEIKMFTQDISLYDALSVSTDDYIVMCDIASKRFYFPQKMVEEFNLPCQVITDAIPIWLKHVHIDDQKEFLSDINALFSGQSDTHNQEYRVQTKDGTWVWLRARGHVERDDKDSPSLFVVVLTNLGKKSKVDHLTGLLDKYEFELSTRSILSNNISKGSLLVLGLDNFRYINNIYGWDFGDSVLKESTVKLLSALPEKTQLYRLDGDKFGVFFANADLSEAESYFEALKHVFRQHRHLEGHPYHCTVSGGCAYFEGIAPIFGTLFKQAVYALDTAKRDGKNRLVVYDELSMSKNDRMLSILASLHSSVDAGCKDFEVYFQPQIIPGTFQLNSAEALLRWNCPELEIVSPGEFIPLLEQSGLIHTVGRWVLKQSMDVCKQWRKISPDFTISVNLSFVQLQEQSFLPYLTEFVKSEDITPGMLHLEITESCIADGSRSLAGAVNTIRDLGIKIEMDDFGTGYSSLEILKNSPCDVVKIDHAFVQNITHSAFDATFISFIVTLCHSVNIRVCLEGVETWEEYHLVEPMGLDMIQGFLFGRPQPRLEFEKRLLLSTPKTDK